MKVKVKIGEEVHEVDPSSLTAPDSHRLAFYEADKAPDGFVSTKFMNEEMERRTSGKVNKKDLFADDDFWKEFAGNRGVTLDKDGKPVQPKDIDVAKLHEDWKRQHLEPVTTKNQNLEKSLTELRDQNKLAALLRAAEQANVRKSMRTPIKNGTSAIENFAASFFEYDPESRQFAQVKKRGEDGTVEFEYSPNPSQDRRYAGFGDFFGELKKQPEFEEWFDKETQTGSGFRTNGSGGSKRMTREQFEGMSPSDKTAFMKEGGELE